MLLCQLLENSELSKCLALYSPMKDFQMDFMMVF